jgi:sirohydrochlorin cobaltochelatase
VTRRDDHADPPLVLVGHGSHLNPDSSAPVRACADRLRGRWDGPVHTGFWKEQPSLRAVLDAVVGERAVVVPVMTSGGYFVDEVFPRELALEDRPGVADADPVGTHPALSAVVTAHAADVTDGAAPASEFALALVGHGTDLNDDSGASTRDHAARLRAETDFGEVRALFMDEAPKVDDLTDHVEADRVVLVPLFVANGYHVTEDIPADVGLPTDGGGDWPVPATVDGIEVYYADAVGTNPALVDVALARAREAADDLEARRQECDAARPDRATRDPGDVVAARRAFIDAVQGADADPPVSADGPAREWGQLLVAVEDADLGTYALRHVDDRDVHPGDLDALSDRAALRDRVRFDDDGRYRPLAGARTLPTGWRLAGLDAEAVVRSVEAVYPTSVVDWHRGRTGDIDATDWASTAARQTGSYADVGDLAGDALDAAAEACCGGCVRRRAWDAAADEPVDADGGDGAIPCREPCSLFVAAARAFLALEDDDAERGAVDRSVRPGAVGQPGNVYRERYLAIRAADGSSGALADLGEVGE